MNFLHDLKFSIRSLSRTKGLAITVVLTLALGIGANAAIFSLVRGVLLRPLVNSDEESRRRISWWKSGSTGNTSTSPFESSTNRPRSESGK